RRHTRSKRDWSSDVCSSDLAVPWPPRSARPSGPRCARSRRGTTWPATTRSSPPPEAGPGTAQHTARRPAPRHTEAHHTTPQTQAVTAEVDVDTWNSAVTACVCRAGGRERPREAERGREGPGGAGRGWGPG